MSTKAPRRQDADKLKTKYGPHAYLFKKDLPTEVKYFDACTLRQFVSIQLSNASLVLVCPFSTDNPDANRSCPCHIISWLTHFLNLRDTNRGQAQATCRVQPRRRVHSQGQPRGLCSS